MRRAIFVDDEQRIIDRLKKLLHDIRREWDMEFAASGHQALEILASRPLWYDMLLTVMASSIYRLLGTKVGNGFETAKSKHIFRDMVNATANLSITQDEVTMHFHKRAPNPQWMATDLPDTGIRVP